jgi:CRP/FNR family transcriptional regulator, cyclic AMP receptor protein
MVDVTVIGFWQRRCAAQRTGPQGSPWRRLQREETMETIADLLESHPFFAGLSPYALELIAGCASNVHFDEGSRIFDQGEPANLFYVIRHGSVALEVHSPAKGPLIIDTMDGGEVLGWSWLIPPYHYFAAAVAVTPVGATALDGACLRGKCEADPDLGYQLLKRVTTVMYQRLQSARIRLLDLYG